MEYIVSLLLVQDVQSCYPDLLSIWKLASYLDDWTKIEHSGFVSEVGQAAKLHIEGSLNWLTGYDAFIEELLFFFQQNPFVEVAVRNLHGRNLECVNGVQYELGLQAYDDVDVDKYLDYGQVDELWLVEVSDSVENEVDGELEQVEED